MKRIIIAIGSALVACSMFCHADPDSKTLVITTVPTNATAQTSGTATTDGPVISGWVESIMFDFTGTSSSPTCDVDIITWSVGSGNGTLTNRTILSTNNVAAELTLHPRELADTTGGANITGAAEKIPLLNDKVIIKAYAATTNGGSFGLTTYLIYSHRP